MGDGELALGRVNIHYNPSIDWHSRRLHQMAQGLATIGLDVVTTTSRVRISEDPAVLFGTSNFQNIEKAPGDWLLVDRAFWGDPDNVRLGWNGRGIAAETTTTQS